MTDWPDPDTCEACSEPLAEHSPSEAARCAERLAHDDDLYHRYGTVTPGRHQR